MDLVTMVLACSLYSNNSIINAMVQVGSQNNALMVTPEGKNPIVFSTIDQAISYADTAIQQGQVVDVGLMQIPSPWFTQYHVTASDLLRPCKNIMVGSQVLLDAQAQCMQKPSTPNADPTSCALSTFKSGNATDGSAYAQNIIKYATTSPFVKPADTLLEPSKPATSANSTTQITTPASAAAPITPTHHQPKKQLSTPPNNTGDDDTTVTTPSTW